MNKVKNSFKMAYEEKEILMIYFIKSKVQNNCDLYL